MSLWIKDLLAGALMIPFVVLLVFIIVVFQ